MTIGTWRRNAILCAVALGAAACSSGSVAIDTASTTTPVDITTAPAPSTTTRPVPAAGVPADPKQPSLLEIASSGGEQLKFAAYTPTIQKFLFDEHPEKSEVRVMAGTIGVLNTGTVAWNGPVGVKYRVIVGNPGACDPKLFGCDPKSADTATSYGPAVVSQMTLANPPKPDAYQLAPQAGWTFNVVGHRDANRTPGTINETPFWWYLEVDQPDTAGQWLAPPISAVRSSDGSAVPEAVVTVWRDEYDSLARLVPLP